MENSMFDFELMKQMKEEKTDHINSDSSSLILVDDQQTNSFRSKVLRCFYRNIFRPLKSSNHIAHQFNPFQFRYYDVLFDHLISPRN